MKLCIVASRALDPKTVEQHVMLELAGLLAPSVVLLRKPRTKGPRAFEQMVAAIAGMFQLDVQWWQPEPGGREMTFLRDVLMVQAADSVLAYFPEGSEMAGGTGHVVEKALDQARECRAFSMVDGKLHWVGGYDPSTDL